MFENLSRSLKKALTNLKGHGQITESNISVTLKEIRRILVQSDVEYSIAKQLTNSVKDEALGKGVIENVSPRDFFIKIFHDHVVKLLGEKHSEIVISGNPSVILLCGLQGAGKTTLAAKLANHLKKKGRGVMLCACDVYRPGAIDQLKILANQIEIPIYTDYESKDPLQIAKNAIEEAKKINRQVVIVDTAGRLSIDEAMMNEIKALKAYLNPSETIFVVDSMIGQSAVKVAQQFNEAVNFDSIILTKMDSDNQGGCALSIVSAVNKPIKFASTGEKIDDFTVFYPDRMANRILGMGDIVSLVEKAEELISDEEARRLEQKIRKSKFDFNDLLTQIKTMEKMGGIKSVFSMMPSIPGLKMPEEESAQNYMEKIKFVIQSMTPYERTNPISLNSSRISRIAKGSGVEESVVVGAIKKVKQMQNLMQKVKDPRSIMNMLQNKLGK